MSKFKNAYILCYSPEHVRAVVDEGERLGYTRRNAPNYKDVTIVRFSKLGYMYLRTCKDANLDEYINYLKETPNPPCIRIMQTRHLRTQLAPLAEVLSQDGNSVLHVGQNPVQRKSWRSKAKDWILAQVFMLMFMARRVYGFLTGK